MSDVDPAVEAPTKPMLYARPELLEASRHGAAGLRPHQGYAFAASANAVPLNVAEFARAAVSVPIVFAGAGRLSPVAVTGLRQGRNLLVDADGAWDEDAYVPGYLRRHPFILARAETDGDRMLLCIDGDSPRLAPDIASEPEARPLFENGEPAEVARDALEFCLTYQRQAIATESISARLQEAGVLRPRNGEVRLASGETLRLTDFHVVDETALNALDDAAATELRRSGALAAAYCQLVSQHNWARLGRREQARVR